MGKQRSESKIELTRRSFVERRERQLDLEERCTRNLEAATTREERDRLGAEFASQRQEYREAEINAGRRLRETHILMHRIMWAQWLEVVVEQEIRALEAFGRIQLGETKFISDEFRASLLALTGAAHTIEALYGEIKYLFPSQQPMNNRHQTMSHTLDLHLGSATMNLRRCRWKCAGYSNGATWQCILTLRPCCRRNTRWASPQGPNTLTSTH